VTAVNGIPAVTFPGAAGSVTLSVHTPEAAAVVTLTLDDIKAVLHALIDADVLPIAGTIWKAFAKLPHASGLRAGVGDRMTHKEEAKARVVEAHLERAARHVVRDWLVVCEKYPVTENLLDIHPFGKAIAWDSLFELQRALNA
jgi:hypothetical protein